MAARGVSKYRNAANNGCLSKEGVRDIPHGRSGRTQAKHSDAAHDQCTSEEGILDVVHGRSGRTKVP